MKNWEFPPSVKISKTYEFDEYELNGEKWYRIIDEDNIETDLPESEKGKLFKIEEV